jgi:hypothetical protein
MATRLEQWYKEEVRAVIRFLNARHVSAAEIHRQLVEVYGEEVMSRLWQSGVHNSKPMSQDNGQ